MENTTVLRTGHNGVLNRNQIKYIVIIAMLIDHIAWLFVDAFHPFLGGCMHLVGRLTGPTMAYFIGEGYSYTRNAKKYQQRLALFALLSWLPFVYMEFGALPIYYTNGQLGFIPVQSVIYTLFLGLTAIRLWDSKKWKLPFKIIGIILLCVLSLIGDWAFMDVFGCLFVHIFRNRPKAKWTAYTLTFLIPCILMCVFGGFAQNWYQLGVILAPLMLFFFYNGQGGSKAAVHKWFFYAFYPAHMLVLGILRWIICG